MSDLTRRDFLGASTLVASTQVAHQIPTGPPAWAPPPGPAAAEKGAGAGSGARGLVDTGAIDFLQFDCFARAGISEWRRLAGMASALDIWMAPQYEPVLHGHLLASIPNGYILESFANPDRDPCWFELYSKRPEINNSVLTLGDDPGMGVEFDPAALAKYGTKVL